MLHQAAKNITSTITTYILSHNITKYPSRTWTTLVGNATHCIQTSLALPMKVNWKQTTLRDASGDSEVGIKAWTTVKHFKQQKASQIEPSALCLISPVSLGMMFMLDNLAEHNYMQCPHLVLVQEVSLSSGWKIKAWCSGLLKTE